MNVDQLSRWIIHKVLHVALFGVDSKAIKCEVNFPSLPALFIGSAPRGYFDIYQNKIFIL